MTYTEDALWGLLREAAGMPYGRAQIAAVEQVIPHADAQRLTELAFRARLLATNAYVYGGEPARSFVTFSWCLAEHDAHPQRYQRWRHTLLWQVKYMVAALVRYPEIPLARTFAVLDDMQRRWHEGGQSPHAVYAYRHLVAQHVGDLDAAAGWFDQWRIAARDDLSDCAGCDPTAQVRWLTLTGRDDDAVALAEPVLAGRLSCSEQPQGILTALLLPYLRTGREQQARDAHLRAYPRLRPNLADLAEIGDHLQFCARTGNAARSLEMVLRHLPWLQRAPSAYAEMVFCANAALALQVVAASGYGTGTVRLAATGADGPREVPVGQLAGELATRARAVARRFDSRNGTPWQGRLIEEILAVRPSPRGDGVGVPAAGAGVPATVGLVTAGRAAGEPDLAGAGPDELLAAAEQSYRARDPARAYALWRAFGRRYPDGGGDGLRRARYADGTALALVAEGDLAAASAAWRSAVDGYTAAGDRERAEQARGRLGLALCQDGSVGPGLELLEPATSWLRGHGSVPVRTGALVRLAQAYAAQSRYPQALAVLAEADAEAEAGADAGTAELAAVDVALARARVLAASGDLAGADGPAQAALAGYRRSGRPWPLAGACLTVAQLAEARGDHEQALAGYDEALAATVAAGTGGAALRALRGARARLLAGTSRAGEALDDLADEVADLAAQGRDGPAAASRYHLAAGYLNAGQPAQAATVAEEALAWLVAHDPGGAMRVRHLLATLYRRLDDLDAAIAQLEIMAADRAGAGDQAGLAELTEDIADLLDRLDRDDLAAQRYAAAALGYAAAGRALDQTRASRRYATSLLWSGDVAAAQAALAEAERLAGAPDPDAGTGGGDDQARRVAWERALLGYDGARILGRAGRLAEATERAGAALARFRLVPAPVQAAHAGGVLADLLLRAGDLVAAERAARAALGTLPDQGPGRPALAATLAAVLQAQGRTGEADAVRREHGVAAEPD